MYEYFTAGLLSWGAANRRDLPWVGERDPYLVWLSEVILQQTRVDQGLPYYERFVDAMPTVEDMAKAPESAVMKLWEGLGYYSRARNMHATARYIVDELNGKFPTTYDGLLSLKGVGPYTAAAIASFAYALPHAVVDGNVYRVLSRFFGISIPIDSTRGKKEFAQLAQDLLPGKKAAAYNQAIMDFGSRQCSPRQPDCFSCPFTDKCAAHASDTVADFPVKEKRIKRRQRFFNYCIIEQGAQVWLKKREEKDIWQNLYEFPLIERESEEDTDKLLASPEFKALMEGESFELQAVSPWIKHELTHQKIKARFLHLSIQGKTCGKPLWGKAIERHLMGNFAFPRLISRYLN